MSMHHWLLKTEPNVFSITDLQQSPKQTTCWEGVRNYQARNFLRDAIHVGDTALFYHSRLAPMAVVGIVQVVRGGYPDPSQFDPKSKYFDAQATPDKPRWYAVDVQLLKIFNQPITLASMREQPSLQGMMLLKPGSRLSVQPVQAQHYHWIVEYATAHDHQVWS